MRERPGAVYGNGKNIAAAAAPRGERKALCGQMENAYRGHCSENGDSFLLKEVGMEVTLLTREDMARTLERLAYEVLERHHGADELLLVGIQRRGVDLARRLARILGERVGRDIPLGTLDINLYRDDWTSLSAMPALGASSIPLPLEGRQVILVDDVLYTGRTVRAALGGAFGAGGQRSPRIAHSCRLCGAQRQYLARRTGQRASGRTRRRGRSAVDRASVNFWRQRPARRRA